MQKLINMNNWTISEEAKKMLAELKPLIELNVQLPLKVYRCKYCSNIIVGHKKYKAVYCDEWCKGQTKLSIESGECEKCKGEVYPYVFMSGKRIGQSTHRFPKFCETCKPIKHYKIKNKNLCTQ